MKIYVLFGKRYDAEDGVFEALEAVDEVSENVDGVYMHEKYHEWSDTGDFEILKVIAVMISTPCLENYFAIPIMPATLDTDKLCDKIGKDLDDC